MITALSLHFERNHCGVPDIPARASSVLTAWSDGLTFMRRRVIR
jgi:hypothetical protein